MGYELTGKMIARDFRNPRRGGRLVVAALLGTTFLAGLAVAVGESPALAAAAEDDMVDITGLTAVGDRSLDDLRGGFSIGPFNVNFGVVIKTAINQMQVLQTSFVVTKLGQISDFKQNFLHDNNPAANAAQNAASAAQNAASAAQSAAQEAANAAQDAAQDAIAAAQGAASSTAQTQAVSSAAEEQATQVSPPLPTGELPAEVQNLVQTVLPEVPAVGDPNAGSGGVQEVLQQVADVIIPAPQQDPAAEQAGAAAAAVQQAVQGNFSLTSLENGVHISNNAGTEILQQIQGGVMTQIINEANGMDISHATELNMFITNFTQVVAQGALSQATNGLALQSVVNNPLLGQ